MEKFFQLLERFGDRAIDISVRVAPDVPVWPGDPPAELCALAEHGESGHHLSWLGMTVHTGTHLDAPFHFLENGKRLPEFGLESFFLRAKVLHYRSAEPVPARWLAAQDLNGAEAALFRTRNSEWWRSGDRSFHEDYVALTGPAAQRLAERGLRLVGIDYLSVDPFNSTDFPAHRALLGAGSLILETIRLDAVPPGDYGLVCLPLLLSAPDAAPARAVLLPLD